MDETIQLHHIDIRTLIRALDRAGRSPVTTPLRAILASSRGRAVAAETLVDAIWGSAAPLSVRACINVMVWRLRREGFSVASDWRGFRHERSATP